MGKTIESAEQRAAGALMASFNGPEVPDWLRRRVEDGLGGVCLFGSNLAGQGGAVSSATRVADALHRANPSVVVALDEEGGAVTRLEVNTGSSIPGNAALGAVDDPDLTRRVARALGEVLAATGVDLNLAPCADINVDAANPVIGVRSFSADAPVVSRHVAAFVDGLQAAGVAACVKHFPGHGDTSVDSHLDLPVVEVERNVLDVRELAPFWAAIAAGAAAIMTAHLRVPALDSESATVSREILTGLLRNRMRFRGAVVTDALDMAGIGGPDSIPANVVRSLAAGADLCCLGPDATDELVGACIDAIVGALHSGGLDEARLEDAVARTAQTKLRPTSVQIPPNRSYFVRLEQVGSEAARRALRVEGDVPIPLGPVRIIELHREPMIASGPVPWGLSGTVQNVEDAERTVVVVRDPQCDADTADQLAELLSEHPDAIVVDMGWPANTAECQARVVTFGPARVSSNAVAQLLAGMYVGTT